MAYESIDTMSDVYKLIIKNAQSHTMIGIDGLAANMDAVEYVVKNRIPGAIVECGVWKGGSCVAMLQMLQVMGDTTRDCYLFDTYAGMTEPSEFDISYDGEETMKTYQENVRETHNEWAYAPLEAVKSYIAQVQYPEKHIHFIKGDVRETIPQFAKKKPAISILRLDTDWYDSTKVELDYLYDLVPVGGVIIIDDYGHFAGSRKAVDEFLAARQIAPLLHRIDYTRRMFVKQVA